MKNIKSTSISVLLTILLLPSCSDSSSSQGLGLALPFLSGNSSESGNNSGGGDGGGGSSGPEECLNQTAADPIGTDDTDPESIFKDHSGNIYLAGQSTNDLGGNSVNSYKNAFVIKYRSGDLCKEWITVLDDPSGNGGSVNNVLADLNGNIYVLGLSFGAVKGVSCSGYPCTFLSKLNSSNGSVLWTKMFPEIFSKSKIALDPSGNIYWVGSIGGTFNGQPASGLNDAFIQKIEPNGDLSSVVRLGNAGTATIPYAVAIDSDGNIILAGQAGYALGEETSSVSNNMYVAKFDSSLALQWVRLSNFTNYFGQVGTLNVRGATTDASGNIYVLGDSSIDGSIDGQTSQGDGNIFTMKYNSSGTKQWTRLLGGLPGTPYAASEGITMGPSGNIYIVGRTSAYSFDSVLKIGNADVFATIYQPNGTKVSTNRFGTSGTTYFPIGVTYGGSGGVYFGTVISNASYDSKGQILSF